MAANGGVARFEQ